MKSLLLLCFATAVCSCPIAALCQDDALAALMAKKKLSNVPATYQDKVKPGSIITMSRDGSLSFFDADATAMPYAVAAMKGPLPTITIESIKAKISDKKGFVAKFLSWAPGVQVDSSTSIDSDQAVLSVASLDQDQLDNLVYNDPLTLKRYQGWNKPGKKITTSVYVIEAVYWATELQITSASSKGINAATGGSLPKCTTDAAASDPKSKAAKGDGTQTDGVESKGSQSDSSPGQGKSKSKTSSVKSTAATAGTDALKSAAKDVASIASAAVDAAGKTTVTISGGSCVDKNDVAHLKSETPVPVGMKVNLIGYFTVDAETFDWSPVPPPRF